ncbi:putative methionine transporter (NhaC family) [Sinobacterium caligoides]|uniref:Putative methionine transporter (NhaC family) n=1 Tax=Sinobacterium caligoides TaxID=933926 RepID=A0A3N2DYM1_9GAMM|nr:Na+/H+ antiporter NhaC family protein [Sinobacterium caligoides]ROS04950.1 putative methionine transporter (NhaC family) [Sinobacterium caligoides]
MKTSSQGRAIALLPFLLFVALFVGTGTYLSMQGVDFAFYQLPAPIAILPAIVLAVLLSRDKLNETIESFIGGVGDKSIIAMCLIYLLAGAFSSVAKATGGVDATVALGLSIIPAWFLLPGIFIISGFIATAMGTSMGTIGAVAPIALGVAESAGIPLPLMAGAVLSGATFGDNLSIISDTTIAATRTQGCEMKDKFRENVSLAIPAALVAALLFFVLSGETVAPEQADFAWLSVLPYLTILALAVYGVNVFIVLALGLLLAGGVGMSTIDDYSLASFVSDIYAGFTSMQEIFLLSLLIGGLGALMEKQGGLAFIEASVTSIIARLSGGGKDDQRTAELGIASSVSLTNLCTANNTVAIIVTGNVAKDMAANAQVSPKRAASLLDIFSCIVQGLIPWGAQALLLGSIFTLSPLAVVEFSFYPMLLALVALSSIVLKRRK